MGMYTELNIGVRFKRSLSEDIVAILSAMAKGISLPNDIPPQCHPLFKTDRWAFMLHSAGSYYFDAKSVTRWEYDPNADAWFLTVIGNIKNYNQEWELFLAFIAPHLDTQGYLGTLRYEEAETPTLLYNQNGILSFLLPTEMKELK